MSPRAKNFLKEYWPLLAALSTGLIAWGSLEARVSFVETSLVAVKTDHDVLIKVSTQQDTMQKQLERIEGKLGGQPGGVR